MRPRPRPPRPLQAPPRLTPASPTAAKELVLVPLHAAPHHAVAEIDALYDVYLDIIDKWGSDVSPRRTALGPRRQARTALGLLEARAG